MTYQCVKALRQESDWYLRNTERKPLWLKVTIIFDNREFIWDLDINNLRGVGSNEVAQRVYKSEYSLAGEAQWLSINPGAKRPVVRFLVRAQSPVGCS